MSAAAFGRVQIGQDSAHQTSEISSLADNERGCGSVKIAGKIAKRTFADDALTVTGFVVQGGDGSRQFVNVLIPDNLDRFTHGAVMNGLQRLLKEGRSVTGRAVACGSGPVLTLEHIQ